MFDNCMLRFQTVPTHCAVPEWRIDVRAEMSMRRNGGVDVMGILREELEEE